jgi:AbrB family looped-hinge helix DNA binding protein
MRITARGQVTIPKHLRERLGMHAGTEVEFVAKRDRLRLRKRTPSHHVQGWDKWIGYCRRSFQEMGDPSVDEYIDMVRGR